MSLNQQFTSTGHKFFVHQEAMTKLRNGQGMPVVTHAMLTDLCQHTCAFCSVATREGNALTMTQIREYLSQLVPLGLKAVILSGGGNPILYRCRETKADFNDAVDLIKSFGLEIGLITNGMKLKAYPDGRISWLSVRPETLDKLTWIRISMSGLDHKEREVFVPDIDPELTTLGFSYVYHDIYHDAAEPNHGKVSTVADIITPIEPGDESRIERGEDRFSDIMRSINFYVKRHNPVYVRLLPNCLEPERIPDRCAELQEMADAIDPSVVFVQFKPPKAPNKCFLGYVHPVLNSDGYVYPCDSCVLNAAAGHKFANPWRVCRWDEIGAHYAKPIRSLVDPKAICPGCVFTESNLLLEQVADGMETPVPEQSFTHPNFV
jgi:hypothetical protein